MPKRTTPFQMVVAFVRQHWAGDDVEVTESKGLIDARLGIEREVDVVIEGRFDGEPVVTSVEVIEHCRPASLPWVEQQVGKHRYLPTNRLVLVSKSGFTKNALTAVAAEGGWVEAVRPVVIEVNGKPVVERLYLDQVELMPTACRLRVERPNGESILVTGMVDGLACTVFSSARDELGTAIELTREVLSIDWVLRKFLHEAQNHPERDELKGFSFGVVLKGLGYHLREDSTGGLDPITNIEIEGEFRFLQEELAFTLTNMADRRFGVTQASFLGRETVWVQTANKGSQTTRLSWRTTDDKPLREPPPELGVTARFPALAHLQKPVDWPPPVTADDVDGTTSTPG